jgi:GT2 family glycosyltransferase
VDPDYQLGGIGYGDDVDLAWRLQLFGFTTLFVPTMQAWHDRSTTKDGARNWRDAVRRVGARRRIALAKRRLDWANVRFTIIKNARAGNLVRQFPRIVLRELAVFGYMFLFEPAVFGAFPRFLRLLPRMLARRHIVQAGAVHPAVTMRTWYQYP